MQFFDNYNLIELQSNSNCEQLTNLKSYFPHIDILGLKNILAMYYEAEILLLGYRDKVKMNFVKLLNQKKICLNILCGVVIVKMHWKKELPIVKII
jgi:hypothetical protein